MDAQAILSSLFKRVHITSEVQEDLGLLLSSEPVETLQKPSISALKVLRCPESTQEYLCCDFNNHQKSYRSPYSNKYLPSIEGPVPSKSLRDIEIRANSMFEEYKDSFYKHGISSVYIKETSERSYAVCFAVKKSTDSGSTDVSHTIDLIYDGHHKIILKLTTKFLVKVLVNGFSFQGSVCKYNEEALNRMEDSKLELAYMIKMIENMEGNLKRYTVNFIQSKSVQVCNTCRSFCPKSERERDVLLIKGIWNEQVKGEIEEGKLNE